MLELVNLPAFYVAYALSVAALVAFLTWALVDASFDCVVDVALTDLRIRSSGGMDIASAHKWKELGPRLLVFLVLTTIALIATGIVFVGLLRGAPQGRTLLAVVLAAGWAGLFLAYQRLLWGWFLFRVLQQLASFRRLAEELAKNWPQESGVLPVVGRYMVDERYPNVLVVGESSPEYKFWFRERVCPFVRRGVVGGILFEFWSPDRRLEIFPLGGQPQSFVDVFDIEHQLLGTRRLGKTVYLTWYAFSKRPSADRLDPSGVSG